MKFALVLLVLLSGAGAAEAGAWTEGEDQWQLITQLIYSDADRGYDAKGYGRQPLNFQRILLQNSVDYGWDGSLTLFARAETALAYFRDPAGQPAHAVDNALEAGSRVRLLDDEDYGIVSLEGSLRTAGAFNFAVSANSLASGRSANIRLLYGLNFRWEEMDGFADLEAGESFLSRPRPNETPIDLTLGLWLDARTLVMLQSFNLIGAGGGNGWAYPYFRSHKIELSAVRKLGARYSVQLGAFFSPAGQNALVEQGVCLSLWSNF